MDEFVSMFIPAADGGILSRVGCVLYSTSAIAPGVFAIVGSDDARIRKGMKSITDADGPRYLHRRPYHLSDLETPSRSRRRCCWGVTVAAEAMHAEVVCTAKRDIEAGAVIDGIGGPDWYGTIMTYPEARAIRAVPIGIGIGIGAGAVARRRITKGAVISDDDVAVDEITFVARLCRLQDALNEQEGA